jgi:O-antigen/teichoic acid export membrane protein
MLLSLVGIWALGGVILHFTHLPLATLWILGAVAVLGFPSGFPEMLQAQDRFCAAAWILQFAPVVNTAAILLMAGGALPVSPVVLIAAFGAGSIGMTIMYLVASRHTILPIVRGGFPFRGVLLFSWPFFFHGIGVYALDCMDVLVLRWFVPMAAIGIYSVAYGLNTFFRSPVLMISPLIMPQVVSAHIEGRNDRTRWFYATMAPQINLLVAQMVALAMLLLPLIETFVGDRFRAAAQPLCILMAGVGFHTMTVLMTPMFYAAKRIGVHVAAYLCMAAVNLALAVILVPRVGMIGAALAKVCADCVGLIFHAIFFKRIFGCGVLRGVAWSLPCWIVMASVLAEWEWPVRLGVWLLCAVATLIAGRAVGLFDARSAEFLAGLGLPGALGDGLLRFYRRFLIPPNACRNRSSRGSCR